MKNKFLFIFFILSFMGTSSSLAFEAQEISLNSGAQLFYSEDATSEIISFRWAFRTGSAEDAKPGLSGFYDAMIYEGAGELNAKEFQNLFENNAISFSCSTDIEFKTCHLKCLKEDLPAALRLVRLAIYAPLFEPEGIALEQKVFQEQAKSDFEDARFLASKELFMLLLGKDHPYTRITYPKDYEKITREDLLSYKNERLVNAKDHLYLAFVGPLSVKEVKNLANDLFDGLPKHAKRSLKKDIFDFSKEIKQSSLQKDFPQTRILFAHPFLKLEDPDFFKGYILNHIIGGSTLSSLLGEEIRKKRGLTYGISTYIDFYSFGSLMVGSTAVPHKNKEQVIEAIKKEWQKVRNNGVTREQFEKARSYLLGSYEIGLESNTKISNRLLFLNINGQNTNYIQKRRNILTSLTYEDIQNFAKSYFNKEKLVFVTVGK